MDSSSLSHTRWKCQYHIVSKFMGYLKGKSDLMIYDKHPDLQSKWSKAFWARGYYAATVGNITEEAIKRYIREQEEESKKNEKQGASFRGG